MEKVYEFMKKCGTYYLATEENGQPRVRPFGTVDLFDGGLYIQTGKVKPVSQQLHENPRAEICCFDGQTWLRLACTLVSDERREAKVHMLEAYPSLRRMYSPDDGNTEIFRITNATAVFASFGAAPETVTF